MNTKQQQLHAKAIRLARNSILLALAATLSFLESLIPLPYGIRLGLSGLVTLYAIFFLPRRDACGIILLKAAFVLLTRGVTAGILSLAGGMLSLLGMVLLAYFGCSLLLISSLGGLLHNIGQLSAAALLMQSDAVWSLLPLLTACGILAGALTAAVFHLLMKHLPKTLHPELQRATARKG